MELNKSTAPKKKHYVDSKKFYEAVCTYKLRLKYAADNHNEKPKMPDYLGLCFWQIAENYSNHRWFRSFPFKDEMISDAVFFCIKYIDSFNPEKTQNAFAYFTRVVHNAFQQRIQKERKYLYTKFKAIENTEIFTTTSDKQDHDGTEYSNDVMYSDNARTKMGDFVTTFEEHMNKRKKAKDETVDKEA